MVKLNKSEPILTVHLLILPIIFIFSAFLSPQLNATIQKDLTKLNNINVLFVNPSKKNDPFWHEIEKFTRLAAKTLQLNLTIIQGGGTRFFQLEELEKYFLSNPHPDYIVLLNYSGSAKKTMNFLQDKKVKLITLEDTLSPLEKKEIGLPGEHYKNWLGEISFDNKKAGELLAKHLIKEAKKANKKPVIAGISGHFGSNSNSRSEGLLSAVKDESATLTRTVHASWSYEDAQDKAMKLLERYPDINIIWCASDNMALGALKAAQNKGLTVGKDIFIGGFDWTNKALDSIEANELSASIGGHVMMGVIAMLAIHDEENNTLHSVISPVYTPFNLALINHKNILQYRDVLSADNLSSINFKALAELYNKEISINATHFIQTLQKSDVTN